MQKKPNILRLLSAPGRYIKLRISSIYKKLVKKTKKKSAKYFRKWNIWWRKVAKNVNR